MYYGIYRVFFSTARKGRFFLRFLSILFRNVRLSLLILCLLSVFLFSFSLFDSDDQLAVLWELSSLMGEWDVGNETQLN